jgi:hypothetical protein
MVVARVDASSSGIHEWIVWFLPAKNRVLQRCVLRLVPGSVRPAGVGGVHMGSLEKQLITPRKPLNCSTMCQMRFMRFGTQCMVTKTVVTPAISRRVSFFEASLLHSIRRKRNLWYGPTAPRYAIAASRRGVGAQSHESHRRRISAPCTDAYK